MENKDCSEGARTEAIVSLLGSAIYLKEIKMLCPFEFVRSYCGKFSILFGIGTNLRRILKKEFGSYRK